MGLHHFHKTMNVQMQSRHLGQKHHDQSQSDGIRLRNYANQVHVWDERIDQLKTRIRDLQQEAYTQHEELESLKALIKELKHDYSTANTAAAGK